MCLLRSSRGADDAEVMIRDKLGWKYSELTGTQRYQSNEAMMIVCLCEIAREDLVCKSQVKSSSGAQAVPKGVPLSAPKVVVVHHTKA